MTDAHWTFYEFLQKCKQQGRTRPTLHEVADHLDIEEPEARKLIAETEEQFGSYKDI